MHLKRIVLSTVFLALSLLAIGCTDQLDVQGITADCKGPDGKDIPVQAVMTLTQDRARLFDTKPVSPKGEALFVIGASNVATASLRQGHRPPGDTNQNTIYTADQVTITIEVKGPPSCKTEKKQITGIPDEFSPQKSWGETRYTIDLEKFK